MGRSKACYSRRIVVAPHGEDPLTFCHSCSMALSHLFQSHGTIVTKPWNNCDKIMRLLERKFLLFPSSPNIWVMAVAKKNKKKVGDMNST